MINLLSFPNDALPIYKKCSVVRITVGSFLVMYALSFQKELFFHGGQPFSRAAPREHKSIGGNLDSSGSCSLRRNGLASMRSEEHTSELQSLRHLVCRL